MMLLPYRIIPFFTTTENTSLFEEINPDRIRYELTPDGSVAHLLKSW